MIIKFIPYDSTPFSIRRDWALSLSQPLLSSRARAIFPEVVLGPASAPPVSADAMLTFTTASIPVIRKVASSCSAAIWHEYGDNPLGCEGKVETKDANIGSDGTR